jgi:hypothetical protein
MSVVWSVPRAWEGEAAFVLGGGDSLRGFDAGRLKGHGRVIAVNDAFRIAPWADVLYFGDRKWFDWNRGSLGMFRGEHIVTRVEVGATPPLKIKRLRRNLDVGLARHPSEVAGWCSGGNAINLAYLFGAAPIVLLGFDMKGGNWHTHHRTPKNLDAYRRHFIPHIERMAPELEREGVTVINATPGSALGCFPIVSLDDILADPPLAANA